MKGRTKRNVQILQYKRWLYVGVATEGSKVIYVDLAFTWERCLNKICRRLGIAYEGPVSDA